MTARLVSPTRRRTTVVAAAALLAVVGVAPAASAQPVDPVIGSRTTVDPPSVERHVGVDSTVTVAVAALHESGATTPSAGVVPGVWVDGRGSLVADGCTAGTAADGTCTITVTSATPGAAEVVAGTPDDVDGPATAVVRWVDHAIALTPAADTVDVGDTNAVTVALTRDDSGAPSPAAGMVVDLDLAGHGAIAAVEGGSAAADGRSASCVTTAAGTCVVELESDDGGASTLTAVATATVGGVDRAVDATVSVTWSAISVVDEERDLDDVEIGDALVIERDEVPAVDDGDDVEEADEDADEAGDAEDDSEVAGVGLVRRGDLAARPVARTEVLAVVRDRRVEDGQLPATGGEPVPVLLAGLGLALAGTVLLRSTAAGSGRTRRAESQLTG